MSASDKNPPISNRGVTVFLDWCTSTMPYTARKDTWIPDIVPYGETSNVFRREGPKDIKPQPPYTSAQSYGPVEIHWNEKHPEFRVMYRIGGNGFQEMRAAGWTDAQTLNMMRANGNGKISRLDFAIDVIGDDTSNPYDVYTSLLDGPGTRRSRVLTYIDKWDGDTRTGATVYIGNRESERFFRVYDKGAKEGYHDNVTRIELEAKGRVASALAAKILRDGIEAGVVEIADAMNPELPWFDWAMSGATGEHIEIKRKETDGGDWLYNTALTAVVEAIRCGDPFCKAAVERAMRNPLVTRL